MKLYYVKVQNAIYGLLRSVLIFYLKLVKDLEAYGFKLNPYDPHVWQISKYMVNK